MRSLTKIELERVKFIDNRNIPYCLFEPTKTGLNKSTFDATTQIRRYLKFADIYNFDIVNNGPIDKRLISTIIYTDKVLHNTKTSFYRSKERGDPRFWIQNINKYSEPNDIWILINRRNKLFAINLTKIPIEDPNFLKTNPRLNGIIDTLTKGFSVSSENFEFDSKLFKLSHGTIFKKEEIQYFLENKLAVIHQETKGLGRLKYSQADMFKNAQIGDKFYLCNGNQSIDLLGEFIEDWRPCEYENLGEAGWIQRKYKRIHCILV